MTAEQKTYLEISMSVLGGTYERNYSISSD